MRKDSRKLKKAHDAFNKGGIEKARKMLLELRETTHDDRLKVDVDLALIPCLNQVDDHGLILEITAEGFILAEKFNLSDAQAFFCSKKAVTLLQKQPMVIHRMKSIKLHTEWFEFATERERDEYKRLEVGLETITKEADVLLGKARQLASRNPDVQYQIIFEEAQARNQILDAFFLVHQKPNKLMLKWRRWAMSHRHRSEIKKQLNEIKKLYILAAQKLYEGGDETGFAYCYFNLALAYRGFWKFRLANYYLNKARDVATRYKIKNILRKIIEVREDIRLKKVSGEDVVYRDFLNGI
ncbi:MAG: hypothetical protein WC702_04840 [Patescibacteria group bacterium]|jgi:hypothetical protein